MLFPLIDQCGYGRSGKAVERGCYGYRLRAVRSERTELVYESLTSFGSIRYWWDTQKTGCAGRYHSFLLRENTVRERRRLIDLGFSCKIEIEMMFELSSIEQMNEFRSDSDSLREWTIGIIGKM